jgi:transglutaminase-like putative cysteine protease
MNGAPLRRFGPDLGLTVAALIAAVSVTRLLAGGLGGPGPGPLLAAAAVGSVLPAALAIRRVPIPLRMLVGTLAVALVSLWATAPGSTDFGLPTGRTWHALQKHLQSAHSILATFALPLRPTEGVVFLAALVAGVVAVVASVLLRVDGSTRLYPGLALLLPFGLLAFVGTQTATRSLALPLAGFVVAAAATLASARRGSLSAPGAPARRRAIPSAAALGVSVVIAVPLIALSLGAGGVGPTGGTAGATAPIPPTFLSLTSRLVALEVDDANMVLFRAHTPYPTYWQVAVLNVLRNGVWVTGPAPAATPVAAAPTFRATVKIAGFSSRVVPVPPATVAVTGLGGADVNQEEVEAARRTTIGERYVTVAAVPDNDPTVRANTDIGVSYPPGLFASEVALPPLPPSIALLAREAVRGALTPLSQAEALVNWFRSGRFRYTLDPPTLAPGADPLVSFLTQTRAGTCQQFAGAFAVLARTLGLPTRVAVGFTAGAHSGADEVTVRGDDAHAWPEVYLGPGAGWVSFEPTPQKLTGEVAAEGVVGPTGAAKTPPPSSVSPPSTIVSPPPTTLPTVVTTTPPTTAPVVVPKSGTGPTSYPSRPPDHFGWFVFVPAVVVIALGLAVTTRRRRRRIRTRRPPVEVSLRAQDAVDRSFRRAGHARPSWQPMAVFAGDMAERLERASVSSWSDRPDLVDQVLSLLADAVTVAVAAEHALYDPARLDAAAATEARQAADRVGHGLRNHAVRQLLSVATTGPPPVTTRP